MGILTDLPAIVLVMTTGFMLFYKNRNIGVPLIILMAFMTSVGLGFASGLGIVGFIFAGAFILGIVALYLRYFY